MPRTPRSNTAAVFLDRDDTLIIDPGYLDDADKVRLVPGTLDALERLQAAGLRLVVTSNQSGVARGLIAPDQIQAIQERLCQLLVGVRIDGFEYCFHHPDDGCGCRKPSPEMILRASRRLDLDPPRSVMVGDRESDVGAGNAAGCWTVRIAPDSAVETAADRVARNLASAVEWILSRAGTVKA
jgi:histidinol-phosphate phosphatase family protein